MNLSWFEERIKEYVSVAAFHDSDPSQPVAWALLYATRKIGNLHTLEAHRRKGLGLAVTAALCQVMLDDCTGIPPYSIVNQALTPAVQLMTKLGFVSTGLEVSYFTECTCCI